MRNARLQRNCFLLLLAAVTIAFGWILLPFFGAVMWAVALAILFTPVYRRLTRMLKGRSNLAALITLTAALVIVVLPLVGIAISLAGELTKFSQQLRTGEISISNYFQQITAIIPRWALDLLNRFGLGNFEALTSKVAAGAAAASQRIATQAVNLGQNAFEFLVSVGLMLYMLFFLLRDGAQLSVTLRDALPLAKPHTRFLGHKFATVIRATIKGNIVVAIVQGAIGGLALWGLGVQGALLLAVLMAVLSLLPAVGAGLVWLPVAIYFLATGAIWQGVTLILIGVFVIGLVDNVLRPLLVGKDTQMPDYIVLMSTVGGIALFGINGFVIGPVIAAMFMAAWQVFASWDNDTVAPALEDANVAPAPVVVTRSELPPSSPADPPRG
ncbi:AI-2E family transporter [Variovorax dokdonensis]|uniref:AI-2E family transporter n=1 Tax=Variovorax dokdonensis TaxID=344883 RepID=A0ABT7NDL1_9BURK|nr:AI-2E family transporter [Variovorax dokdonensis]MDM0046037.1 AI-2E family transporter [Variovorax dokdonensis]